MKQRKWNLDEPINNREVYFDIIRIVSTVSVLLLHISAQNWYNVDIHSFEWNVSNFYDSIVRWGVPVFVMLSGALFLDGNQTIGRIYRKNIFRIVTAFIFWSFFYAMISYIRGKGIKDVVLAFVRGYVHMWFLFLIVGLYMIIPVLRLIIKNDFMTKYFLVLSFVFSFIIPLSLSLLGLINEYYAEMVKSVFGNMDMNFVTGYTFYFILGWYLKHLTLSERRKNVIYIFGIAGFLATIILTIVSSYYYNSPQPNFYKPFCLNVLLESIFIFVFCKQTFRNANFSDRVKRILYHLSKYSFGVYLIHPFFILLLEKVFGLNTLSLNMIISVPLLGTIVFCLSFFVSAILNHIPILKKYIV